MRIVCFLLIMLASNLAKAVVPIDGLYGSLFGGYSYVSDNINRTQNNALSRIRYERVSYTNGFNAGGRFGYQANHWRYEGELTYIGASVDSFDFSLPSFGVLRARNASGQSNNVLGTANVYFDFPEIIPCISPFLGGGLGYGWFRSSLTHRNLFRRHAGFFSFFLPNAFLPQNSQTLQNPIFLAQNTVHFNGSGSAFVYQGTAGLTYNFSENYALNLAYRFVGSTRVNALGKAFRSNLASLGVVYRFNEYNYK